MDSPCRLEILDVLCEGDACVSEICRRATIEPSLASYHLRILGEAGLVSYRRSGRELVFSLRDRGGTILLLNALRNISNGRRPRPKR